MQTLADQPGVVHFWTPVAIADRDYLHEAIAHAPLSPGQLAPNLRGWWTPSGLYVCSHCAGRIMARGCRLPSDSHPVWTDQAEPFGVCICCK